MLIINPRWLPDISSRSGIWQKKWKWYHAFWKGILQLLFSRLINSVQQMYACPFYVVTQNCVIDFARGGYRLSLSLNPLSSISLQFHYHLSTFWLDFSSSHSHLWHFPLTDGLLVFILHVFMNSDLHFFFFLWNR